MRRYLAFFGVALALDVAPGPDILFVMAQSLAHGASAGVYVTLGLCSGLCVHVTLAALGFADVMKRMPALFMAVTWAGAAYLAYLGVKVVTVTGRRVEAREALAKSLGIAECLALAEGGEEAVTARIRALTEDLGADLCVEASGNPRAFAQGMGYLRNRGVYLVPGQYSVSGGVPVSPETITFKALQILGSSQYDMDDIRTYLSFLESHPALTAQFLRTVTAYPVSKVNEAFADIRAGKNIKTLLVPED